MRNYQNLAVWEKSHQLALDVYRATAGFPSAEKYGLTAQLRSAASSIPSNIAEGAGRRTDADFRRFLDIAAGSASEVEYQIRLTIDLEYLPDHDGQRLADQIMEVKKMLRSLSNKLIANH
jgi:four helix bundle protein